MSNIEQEKKLTLSVRLSGKAAIRGEKIQSIQQQVADNIPILVACHSAKTCEASYRRWMARLNSAATEALTDLERTGRPSKEDARERIRILLETQRKRVKGLQGQLNALSKELDALERAFSETGAFAPVSDQQP